MAEGRADRVMSETESVPGHSSLYRCHSQNYVESVSVEICSILTLLGYGEVIRRWRIEKYREYARLETERSNNEIDGYAAIITAGSKAEGLTCIYESDWDLLIVLNNFLCVEAGINLHTIPGEIDVFRMDTCVFPGHCRLILVRPALDCLVDIDYALCDNGHGDVILSSSLLLDEMSTISKQIEKVGLVYQERAGPSCPGIYDGVLHVDRVFSLRCECPSILEKWAVRPRHWPPPSIVQKVVSLGAYVTPVGFKGSEYKHVEWRICFNTGETELVNNLNDTQAKVYVILKMILKDVLRPCKKEITSYVMKNIVLWQAERNPNNAFYARSLFYWLHDGLKELRTAIATHQLSYFMIPERNLMAACGLQNNQQRKWVADITDMMEEGPSVILRLPKIRQAIICHPEPLLWFSRSRMMMEMLQLEFWNRNVQCRDENDVMDESDAIMQEISRRQYDINVEVAQRMPDEGCDVHNLLAIEKRILM